MNKSEWGDNFQKIQESDKGKPGKSYVGVNINLDGTYDYSRALEIRDSKFEKAINSDHQGKRDEFEKQLQSSGALEPGNARAVWYSMQNTIRINKEAINKAKESGEPDSRLEEQVKVQEIQQKILEDIISRFAQDLIVNSIGTSKNFRAIQAEEIANNITADEMLDILQGYVDVYEKRVFEYENEDGKKNIISSGDKDYEKLKTTLKAARNLESLLLSESSRVKGFDERIDEIEEKNRRNEQLSINEIRLLYQLDSNYELDEEVDEKGLRYDEKSTKKINQIHKILDSRDSRVDLSRVTGYSKKDITITEYFTNNGENINRNDGEEALSGKSKINYGDIYLTTDDSSELLRFNNSLHFPHSYLPKKIIIGCLSLNLEDVLPAGVELTLPEDEIIGGLQIGNLKIIDGLIKFPKKIRSYIDLHDLKLVEELELPEEVGGNLDLSGLLYPKKTKFPKKVGGNLLLDSFTSSEGLELPEEVGGVVRLSSLPDNEKAQLRLKYPKLKIE